MRLPPCKHPEPQPTKCPWCKMAMTRDPRYALEWWGIIVNSSISSRTQTAANGDNRKALVKARMEKVPCEFRGDFTGESRGCIACGTRHIQAEVYQCSVHKLCTVDGPVEGATHCLRCNEYSPKIKLATPATEESTEVTKPIEWAYGVTTVPARARTLLPRTLTSLANGGFDKPRLFVDGCTSEIAQGYEREFKLEVTSRYPTIRTFGNWALALIELYIRTPTATRFAIFQDDFVTYKGLREYLTRSEYPDKGYLNLYTFPENQAKAPKDRYGWFKSNQKGLGAVALVFSKNALLTLLNSQHLLERPMDAMRGYRWVDGGVVTAMNKAGWSEYVHTPSLVQHTGLHSSMRSKPQPTAPFFLGEDFDATQLLPARVAKKLLTR